MFNSTYSVSPPECPSVSQTCRMDLLIFLPKSVFPPDFPLLSSITTPPSCSSIVASSVTFLSTFITRSCHFCFQNTAWFSALPLPSSKCKPVSYFITTSASFLNLLASIIGSINSISTQQPEVFFKYKSYHVTVFKIQISCHGQGDLLDLALPTSLASALRILSPPLYSPTLLHAHRLSKYKVF